MRLNSKFTSMAKREESKTFDARLLLIFSTPFLFLLLMMLLRLSLEQKSLQNTSSYPEECPDFVRRPRKYPFQVDCMRAVKQRVGEWMNRVRYFFWDLRIG
jgi:hypothetical protein